MHISKSQKVQHQELSIQNITAFLVYFVLPRETLFTKCISKMPFDMLKILVYIKANSHD